MIGSLGSRIRPHPSGIITLTLGIFGNLISGNLISGKSGIVIFGNLKFLKRSFNLTTESSKSLLKVLGKFTKLSKNLVKLGIRSTILKPFINASKLDNSAASAAIAGNANDPSDGKARAGRKLLPPVLDDEDFGSNER